MAPPERMSQARGAGFFLALPSSWPLIPQHQPNPWFPGHERGASEMPKCLVATRVGFKLGMKSPVSFSDLAFSELDYCQPFMSTLCAKGAVLMVTLLQWELWLRVRLAAVPSLTESLSKACAHRWKNIYYETDHILPHGFCYIIPSNLQAKGRTLIPCYEEYKKKYGEEHGSCQAGIAGFFTEELVVMGAPGSFYWAGTVKVLNLTDNTYFKLNDEAIMNRRYTYLGYAVTAGSFSRPSTTDVVGGAPQDEGVGKVYIFRADRRSGTLIKIFQASGKKMGSYFGSSLCAVDLNADGLSDLLVGAPMFSEIRDEGQVTVYINRGNGALEEQLALSGDGTYNAHFGESIASLGDLDDDGFPDVAIGAPKEDDFSGAVYIYHGDASGIVPQYSMKLSGQKISPVLGMFGQSISGGIDMDGNGYPDVTVGAFMSDSVVLLRARPVITVDVSIFLPASINITAPQCHDGLQPVNCLNVTACFSFHGKHVPGEIGNEPLSEGSGGHLGWRGLVGLWLLMGSSGFFALPVHSDWFCGQQARRPDTLSLWGSCFFLLPIVPLFSIMSGSRANNI
uniref:integrin alpha-9-like n=1 Tax=Panthera onca TaxID=9690 RepID=UPI002955484B|nr:integrin alpha-9-like [Panthera onca]